MWSLDSIKFNENTFTSEEIKVESPESTLNNDDTLCDTDFDSKSHLIGTAEVKRETETNYETCDGESETSRLDPKIKIEFEETDLKKECMNEINETSDNESLKSNSKDFENIPVQSTQEHVIKEDNQEWIEDPLREVAEGNADEGREDFEFIGINPSMCFEEKSNNLDIKVDSDSHVLNHSEREAHSGKNPLNNELDTQILIHTGEKSHKCDICGKSFNQIGHLNSHQLIHTGEKPHKCGVCGKLFRQKGSLKRHYTIHTAEKLQRCDNCGKSFNDKGNLKKHMLIHTGEKPYNCDVCGKSFYRRVQLKTHKLIHTGEKPYKCDICEKLFTAKDNLKKHLLIHTGEKPHKCDICGKLFNRISNFNTHQLIHTGKKPHKCDICGKLFNQIGHLNSHQLIHTGEKPHKCEICGKLFKQKGNLKRHFTKHTAEKP